MRISASGEDCQSLPVPEVNEMAAIEQIHFVTQNVN
jgi:hypothetical protein